MTNRSTIHSDLQNLPAVELSFNPLLLSLMNASLHLASAIKSRFFGAVITHEKIIGPDGHRIPVMIIEPENAEPKNSAAPGGALLYFHGGAFILKYTPQHVKNAVHYAQKANCRVIFVDFRLAPRHAFPKPFNDCYAALIWARQNADRLGIDKQRIAVGGDSAGGALAASVAQKARDEGIVLSGQLLLYPVTDADCKSRSSAMHTDVAPLKRFSVRAMWRDYLGHALEGAVPGYASPAHGQLTDLAPAYIETAEFDPLHDEGIAYAQALIANGVDVQINETLQTVHGYDLVAPSSALSQQAIEARAKFLREIFQT